MKLSNLKDYVYTTKIELNENDYIILREPKQSEILGLSDDDSKTLELLDSIFPDCIVESTITNDDGSAANGKDIYNVLKESGSMMTEILTTWLKSIPFQQRLKNNQKSGK